MYLPPNNGATLQHPDPMRPLSADLKPGETATLAELRARREAAASGEEPPSPDDGLTATERAILNSLPPGGEWLGLEGWLEPLPDDWNPAIIKLQSSGMIEWDEDFENIHRVGGDPAEEPSTPDLPALKWLGQDGEWVDSAEDAAMLGPAILIDEDGHTIEYMPDPHAWETEGVQWAYGADPEVVKALRVMLAEHPEFRNYIPIAMSSRLVSMGYTQRRPTNEEVERALEALETEGKETNHATDQTT